MTAATDEEKEEEKEEVEEEVGGGGRGTVSGDEDGGGGEDELAGGDTGCSCFTSQVPEDTDRKHNRYIEDVYIHVYTIPPCMMHTPNKGKTAL